MSAYEDRLLELDLREVLGAESPPDVWPVLAPLVGDGRPKLRYVPGRRRGVTTWWRGPLTWVAAALLVAGLGVLWWTYRPQDPDRPMAEQPPVPTPVPARPLARFGAPVQVAAAGGEMLLAREAEPGARVVVGANAVTLTLREGATLLVEPRAWLSIDEVGRGAVLDLARGRLAGTAGSQELLVRGGPGDLRVEPGTAFQVERRDVVGDEDAGPWLDGSLPLVASDLVVRVQRGRAAAGDATAVGGQRIAWLRGLPPRAGSILTDETRAYVDRRLDTLATLARLEPDTPASFDADKEATQGARDLETRLGEEPAAWAYAVPWLERRVRGVDASRAGRMALRVLVRDPELRALETIHAKLKDVGTDAGPRELLPLAERAADPVAVDLIRRKVQESTDPFDVVLATYLALHGDDAGIRVLQAALDRPDPLEKSPVSAIAAAAGLYRLGYRMAWVDLRADLRILVEQAIATKQPWRARTALAAASYFAPVLLSQEAVSVYDLSRGVLEHMKGLDLRNAADLRAVLDRIP